MTPQWLNGPDWLCDRSAWPENMVTRQSVASETEVKTVKEVIGVAEDRPSANEFHILPQNYRLEKALEVASWVYQFVHNCKQRVKRKGSLTLQEVADTKASWVQRVQDPTFEKHRNELNLQTNDRGI